MWLLSRVVVVAQRSGRGAQWGDGDPVERWGMLSGVLGAQLGSGRLSWGADGSIGWWELRWVEGVPLGRWRLNGAVGAPLGCGGSDGWWAAQLVVGGSVGWRMAYLEADGSVRWWEAQLGGGGSEGWWEPSRAVASVGHSSEPPHPHLTLLQTHLHPAVAYVCLCHTEFTPNPTKMAQHNPSPSAFLLTFSPGWAGVQEKVCLSLFYNRKIYSSVSLGLAEESMFCALFFKLFPHLH